jgi:UDPglucose 6-dehydrogenase
MKELYLPFVSSEENIIVMDVLSAEMTKYAANAMLATKISFINEIATICEKVGADVNKVKIGIGSDKRIGNHFINPGCGYGGSCFPKDVQALIKTAHNNFYSPKLLNAVESVNKQQKIFFFLKISNYFKHSLENKTFAICGLSFKPETDDMREAPSLIIVQKLIENGAVVKVYDPQSMKHAQDYYFKNYDEEQLIYSSSLYDCAKGADCLVVLTEWKEFKNADMEIIKKQLKKPVIFDGRNIFNKKELVNKGFECFQIGN